VVPRRHLLQHYVIAVCGLDLIDGVRLALQEVLFEFLRVQARRNLLRKHLRRGIVGLTTRHGGATARAALAIAGDILRLGVAHVVRSVRLGGVGIVAAAVLGDALLDGGGGQVLIEVRGDGLLGRWSGLVQGLLDEWVVAGDLAHQ